MSISYCCHQYKFNHQIILSLKMNKEIITILYTFKYMAQSLKMVYIAYQYCSLTIFHRLSLFLQLKLAVHTFIYSVVVLFVFPVYLFFA